VRICKSHTGTVSSRYSYSEWWADGTPSFSTSSLRIGNGWTPLLLCTCRFVEGGSLHQNHCPNRDDIVQCYPPHLGRQLRLLFPTQTSWMRLDLQMP